MRWLVAAVAFVALGGSSCLPRECGFVCVEQETDGGCSVDTPTCVDACPTLRCQVGYALVEDAGRSCAPVPEEDWLVCY